MKIIGLLPIILMLVLDASTATASYISLGITSSTTYQNGRMTLNVSIRNKGDESAYSLKVEARLGTNTFLSQINNSLSTNTSYSTALDLGQAPQIPGIYTVAIKAHYTDAGGFPFTVVSSIPVVSTDPEEINESILARFKPVTIKESGPMYLDIYVRGTNPVNASITMIHPNELSCTLLESATGITPGRTNTIGIAITNLFALSGSSHAVIAVIDYIENGLHRSTAVSSLVTIPRPKASFLQNRKIWGTAALVLLILFCFLQVSRHTSKCEQQKDSGHPFHESRIDSLCAIIVLMIILGCLAYYIPPKYLFMDTTTTGGDTPAHNYLASHLKDQLFGHGRIVSWSNGWWCGFPMFQYYFCLPYLLVALLSALIPFNIAFKLVSVIGIFSLPVCTYASGRMMRLPPPVPILMSIVTIPFLFIGPQTMWGANIYSTFAGMISNSISFPLMLLFIASSWRDADDGQFRIRTTILLILLLASHFFTSIIGGLCAAIIPFLKPKAGSRKAITVLAREYILAFMLMAWWLVPLIAKQEYAVEFGTNWNIGLTQAIPQSWLWPLVFLAGTSMLLAITLRIKTIAIFGWMFVSSTLLFYFGHDHVAMVFVNVRLWPFAFFAILMLCAAGAGLLIARLRFKYLAVLAMLISVLSFGIYIPNNVQTWAEWNYKGFEKNPRWSTFHKLGSAVADSPGRLAYDLHPDTQSFGSSRAFECFPHLFRKPIIEGGIVNSAACSIFSYYIQSETSRDCAGFPEIVKPASFNFTNATRHLELFNVKHFIARWGMTQAALSQSKDWRLVCESEGWMLYELLTHSGQYVYVPENMPAGVLIQSGDRNKWKNAGLEWIYTIQLIDEPFAFLRSVETDNGRFTRLIKENDFLAYCRAIRGDKTKHLPPTLIPHENIKITNETVTDNMIRFRTSAVGLPHLIKCTYSPSWKVKGAEKIFMVTPCFMLVYPDRNEVELHYGYTLSDNTGRIISCIGLLLAIFAPLRNRIKSIVAARNKH